MYVMFLHSTYHIVLPSNIIIIVIYYNILQYIVIYYNILQYIVIYYNEVSHQSVHRTVHNCLVPHTCDML